MTLALRILALLFEFAAIGLFIYDMVKDKSDLLYTADRKITLRDLIIIVLWASNTCLAILLMR